MDEKRATARRAGLWYLLMAVSGPIGILYAPSQVFVAGDAAATAARILENETVLRVGVAASLVCQVSFVFLVLALQRLFEGVSLRHTQLMVALVIAAVPIAIVNELLPLAALTLVRAVPEAAASSFAQRSELALAALDLHEQGIAIASLFWGLWLYPFGRLAMLSGFVPKVLGGLLVLGGVAYGVDATVALLLPEARESLAPFLMLPLAAGELSMIAWLLIRGVR